jgi:hypothetical protein
MRQRKVHVMGRAELSAATREGPLREGKGYLEASASGRVARGAMMPLPCGLLGRAALARAVRRATSLGSRLNCYPQSNEGYTLDVDRLEWQAEHCVRM